MGFSRRRSSASGAQPGDLGWWQRRLRGSAVAGVDPATRGIRLVDHSAFGQHDFESGISGESSWRTRVVADRIEFHELKRAAIGLHTNDAYVAGNALKPFGGIVNFEIARSCARRNHLEVIGSLVIRPDEVRSATTFEF